MSNVPKFLDITQSDVSVDSVAATAAVSLDMDEQKNVAIETEDGSILNISTKIANKSGFIRRILEGDSTVTSIKLDKISFKSLTKIIDYCTYYLDKKVIPIEKPIQGDFNTLISDYDKEFLQPINKDEIFSLINDANYLIIPDILDLLCAKVASMLKDKTTEEMRTFFEIKNDFGLEEEEQARKQTKLLSSE